MMAGDFIMKIIIYLIYLYLTVYTVYFTALAVAGLNKKKKVRDNVDKKYNNICVVVYSHNNKETVENLVKPMFLHHFQPSDLKIRRLEISRYIMLPPCGCVVAPPVSVPSARVQAVYSTGICSGYTPYAVFRSYTVQTVRWAVSVRNGSMSVAAVHDCR